MSGLFRRFSNFASHVSAHVGKVKSKGKHLAGKIKSSVLFGAKKAKLLLHDVKAFSDKVRQISPIVTEIVDIATDLIPGAAPIKRGVNIGLSAFNTISSLADRAELKRAQVQRAAENPNVRNVLDIFN